MAANKLTAIQFKNLKANEKEQLISDSDNLFVSIRAQSLSKISTLSDREIEVFQLIGFGLNSRECATILNLGTSTVDSYRARIKYKLGLKNAAELYQHSAQWLVENQL